MGLFSDAHQVGVFAGYSSTSGLEFHADILLPYTRDRSHDPVYGQFVIIELEGGSAGMLGRITTIEAQGRLADPVGEEYAIRRMLDKDEVSDEMRVNYLRYRVDIRVLGLIRERLNKLFFVPSHRRVPHVGARVRLLSDDLLKHVVGSALHEDGGGEEIGFYALGEFVYAKGDSRLGYKEWMSVQAPCLPVKFSTKHLASRRSVVFARAGYGKSNLMKVLLSAMFEHQHALAQTQGTKPVGMVVFDPEGEYFFPDKDKRPGLCDVPALKDELVVFTDRPAPSGGYERFVLGETRLDVRELDFRALLALMYPEDVDSPNQERLAGISEAAWWDAIDAYEQKGRSGLSDFLRQAMNIDKQESSQLNAAVRKVVHIVRQLHSSSSRTLTQLRTALSEGKLCVFDISLMKGNTGFNTAGIILSTLFDFNQEQFTEDNSQAFPVIAVIEEAQAVLSGSVKENSPFVEWTKEGRKYGLGSILVTQQPGAIPQELLSQADNFFVFHLLSEGDLKALQAANAHFSRDLLSSLLNEPIRGNGIVWSSASEERPYPIPTRIFDFEQEYEEKLPVWLAREPSASIYAEQLKSRPLTSHGEKTKRIREKANELVQSSSVALNTDEGVRISTLAGRLMDLVRDRDPQLVDPPHIFVAMEEIRAAMRRLAPEGKISEPYPNKEDEGKQYGRWVRPKAPRKKKSTAASAEEAEE